MASHRESPCEEDTYSDCSAWTDSSDDSNCSDDSSDSDDGNCSDDSSDSDDDLSRSDGGRCKTSGAKRGETNIQPCKYYNQGHCKDRNCTYLHVCQYYLKGFCKYGSSCRLSHRNISATRCSSSPRRTKRQAAQKCYQWQLKDSRGWSDIKSDYIIEAQYSLPWVKGIKLYNSRYGIISIDFNKMEVRGKDLQVQRKTFASSPNDDQWLWYYRCKFKWKLFSTKGSTIRSAEIERKYQQKTHQSMQITLNHKSYKISFRDMMQINVVTGTKRRLKRRPKYRRTRKGIGCLPESMGHLTLSAQSQRSKWQFSGSHGNWNDFDQQCGTACSVTSADIESQYRENRCGCMMFYVNNSKYRLDFSAMTQTNLSTRVTRSVRRVLLSQ
uniref:protein mono-ADP-ribosyltransferase PARP12-like n=1 Tax=Pristiophorus japonicus TaxID=55135 RepID=UPI00398F3A7D